MLNPLFGFPPWGLPPCRFWACDLATTPPPFGVQVEKCNRSGRSPSAGMIRHHRQLSECCRCPPCEGIRADVRCPPECVRTEYVSAESLGRSSVADGCSLFPPCLRSRLPCRARNLHPLVIPPAACPRTNALTLIPTAHSRKTALPTRSCRCSFAAPALFVGGVPPALSLSPGFVLPAVTLAPPRIPSQGHAEQGITNGWVSRVCPLAAGA